MLKILFLKLLNIFTNIFNISELLHCFLRGGAFRKNSFSLYWVDLWWIYLWQLIKIELGAVVSNQ